MPQLPLSAICFAVLFFLAIISLIIIWLFVVWFGQRYLWPGPKTTRKRRLP